MLMYLIIQTKYSKITILQSFLLGFLKYEFYRINYESLLQKSWLNIITIFLYFCIYKKTIMTYVY